LLFPLGTRAFTTPERWETIGGLQLILSTDPGHPEQGAVGFRDMTIYRDTVAALADSKPLLRKPVAQEAPDIGLKPFRLSRLPHYFAWEWGGAPGCKAQTLEQARVAARGFITHGSC